MQFAPNDPWFNIVLDVSEGQMVVSARAAEMASLLKTSRHKLWLCLMVVEMLLVVNEAMRLSSNYEKMKNDPDWVALWSNWDRGYEKMASQYNAFALSEPYGEEGVLLLTSTAVDLGARVNTLHMNRLTVQHLTVIGDAKLLEFVRT